MSKEVEQKVKQIKLSEIDRLKIENIELKKRNLEEQYNFLEQQKREVIERLCESNSCKIENIGTIDLDGGTVLLK